MVRAPPSTVIHQGAPGPDGQTIEPLRERWPVVLPKLQADMLEGAYRPGEIRRAYIPKAGGGPRGLGIPDVVDRVVCEAVRHVLEPLFGADVAPSSRHCHSRLPPVVGGRQATENTDAIAWKRERHSGRPARPVERVSRRRGAFD
jgi:RNA-directed DNA polymerase